MAYYQIDLCKYVLRIEFIRLLNILTDQQVCFCSFSFHVSELCVSSSQYSSPGPTARDDPTP